MLGAVHSGCGFFGGFMSESYVESKPVDSGPAGEKNTGASAVRRAARGAIANMAATSAALRADTAAYHPRIPMVSLR